MRRIRPTIAIALIHALLLAACGGADRGTTDDQPTAAGQEPLPAPAGPAGAVTGMPEGAGPGAAVVGGPPPAPEIPPLYPADGDGGLPPLEDNPEAGLVGHDPTATPAPVSEAPGTEPAQGPEPGAAGAVAVIRDYYAALAARDYPRAYALWSDGGRSSGQTPEQFADAFASTAELAVQVGDAGPVEGAAGSRYVEIPVSVTARGGDGAAIRQVGAYTLRRAVVDGASAEQRAWRIASAQLRELQP
ncbi:hypothetical protein H0E84_08650 [Luteimonas sp. SJ-92]|uniref:Lipoprotein n=1 Tax=Luteimonas salinisoli TaxID=2752307 RepID=A0A853JCH8_9GAMM|nr:hypothetical protein [Luteimonas salinisoli]NZA26454.1 hypothetical protein [Luteimonas salinisoli]